MNRIDNMIEELEKKKAQLEATWDKEDASSNPYSCDLIMIELEKVRHDLKALRFSKNLKEG